MIQKNNSLSVLPFYDKLGLQHRFKPYAFGAIYPLIADASTLLPFQFAREYDAEDFQLRVNYEYESYYLTKNGLTYAQSGFNVTSYDVDPEVYAVKIDVYNANRVYNDAVVAIAQDANGNKTLLQVSETEYNGTWVLPEGTTYLLVQTRATGSNGTVTGISKNTMPIQSIKLYDKNDKFIKDLTQGFMTAGLTDIDAPSMGCSISVFPAFSPVTSSKLAEGVYYLIVSDGIRTWYSEMFNVVNDTHQYVKIEWWDNQDLVFDSGKIIYENPSFRNILYLDTNIGKPEYKFEEDGKERDGYFFAEKQLSEKVYKFVFIAPEYVCDAVRFVRLSDNIVISKGDAVYNVDSFLAEMNWQDQGDLADVDVEFRTGTVAKKIAAAWPK